MDLRQQKLIIGCLLHDFGKILYRYKIEKKSHGVKGYEYLKNDISINNDGKIVYPLKDEKEILETVEIDENALCYIAYIAENIASGADIRNKDDAEHGFNPNITSESVFNILNGNKEEMVYKPQIISESTKINYPLSKEKIIFSKDFYSEIIDSITDSLEGIKFNDKYINSLIQVLESTLLFVPYSTLKKELRDISLFDHSKLTAAFGICIEQYLTEKGIKNYKDVLFKKSKNFYAEKCFRIYSFDLSGIQNFIYNISSKNALKRLRARSFYLEILLEDIVDELLDRLNLCRANVMYTGGGHTYIIIPATDKAKEITDKFERDLNEWIIDTFETELYVSGGYADCSSNDLFNKPKGSYKEIFRRLNQSISERKFRRYNKENIIKLNAVKEYDHSRECVICHKSSKLNKNNECIICSSLKNLSDSIIDENKDFFAVIKSEDNNKVPLPFGCVLNAYSDEEISEAIKNGLDYKRVYNKNKAYTGKNISLRLWVGDYAAEKEFSKLIANSNGIKRLAVMRANVDNLEQSFVSGFEKSGKDGKYETITRTAVFSRKLSEFFKHHINYILKNGEYQLFDDKENKERNAVIVYSGGDDIFIVGGWDDIICFAVDLRNSFKKFTQNTLNISAGIGIFSEKYPISLMAEKTEELKELSKNYKNGEKNAITLFDKDGTYNWQEFIDDVLGEKLVSLKDYVGNTLENHKALLYKMLELIRLKNDDDRLNIARFAYLLARLKPDYENSTEKEIENYKKFSKDMYTWIQDKEECKRLVTAIYIYIYMNREREETQNEQIK